MKTEYELRLSTDTVVTWTGPAAAAAYAASHPGAVVVAWRETPRHGLFVGLGRIEEARR